MARTDGWRTFLIGWLAGAAVSCAFPVFLLGGLLLSAALDRDRLPRPYQLLDASGFLGRFFCVPALGGAAVGAAVGTRRWWTAVACVAGALVLAWWSFPEIRGKAPAILLPYAVLNPIVSGAYATSVAWRRGDRRGGTAPGGGGG